MPLYDFQEQAVREAKSALQAGCSLFIVSPTGSGKSFMQAELLKHLRSEGLVQLVPSIEIGVGIFSKLVATGHDVFSLSEAEQFRACEAAGIYTVKRFVNLVGQCKIDPPKYLSDDEGHHSVDNTHSQARALCGNPPCVEWSATFYRGTAAETKRLRDTWGEPYVAITLAEAIRRGIISRPDFQVWPLINDETIKVVNGEFETASVEARVDQILPDLVDRIKAAYWDGARFKRPLMIRCPGVASASTVAAALEAAGMRAAVVTGSTGDRQTIFRAVTNREAALVQVRVVGEGVDLPIRVMIDLAPTLSPVLWMQAVGRITRPTDDPPEYIATNHNLTRHAYLWEGQIPATQIQAAQQAWGPDFKPSRRSLARALGLEGFGKFTVSAVPMLDGSYGSLYALQTPDGLALYAVLLHPCHPQPLYFQKTNTYTGRTLQAERAGHTFEYKEKKYGKWKRIDAVPDAEGYVSIKPGKLTTGEDSQLEYWKSAAARWGLDPNADIDARQFQALPMLADTRTKFALED